MIDLETLPERMVASLAEPKGIRIDPAAREGVSHVQTHISHLFLTRDHVYKLRKAVELPFLSFATRAKRNADCLREVELNRRLAPDVYLGVAPVLRDEDGGWHVGTPRESLGNETGGSVGRGDRAAEHCVVMRRLPDGRDALSMIEAGGLERRHVDALGDRLVAFHRETHLGTPAPWSEVEWLARIEDPIEKTFALARSADGEGLDPGKLARAREAMQGWLEQNRNRVLRRREAGCAVDGHGDLHLDHIWYPDDDGPPVIIDCIEFDAELRRIDVAAELAFFTMDAAYRGREDLGEHLLARYAAVSDDYDLFGVVDYHILHRALVRASVAAVASSEAEVGEAQRAAATASARRHLALVSERLDRPSRAALFVTTGLPGTGKSTVAAEAARCVGGVVISSDRVRKHRAGMQGSDRGDAAPGTGLYTSEQTKAVYEGLLDRAEPVVASGRPVVLDATYSTETERRAVRARAERWQIPCLLIEVRCPEAVTLARIAARLRDPGRISDAGPEVYRRRKDVYEDPTDWPEGQRIQVDTGGAEWPEALRRSLRRSSEIARSAG